MHTKDARYAQKRCRKCTQKMQNMHTKDEKMHTKDAKNAHIRCIICTQKMQKMHTKDAKNAKN